jgi:histone demethylase JARID1
VKIPRDAARPKLEDLHVWFDDISHLPFQPEEEEVLKKIIDNAQAFRNHVAGYINPLLSSQAEAETQRFYLRKIEGAEILLVKETNFFRQELFKWCRIADEPPPLIEESKSTRKPRPTKLQKMLAEYGVDDPDNLPDEVKGKANSLRRKTKPPSLGEQSSSLANILPKTPTFGHPLGPNATQASSGAGRDMATGDLAHTARSDLPLSRGSDGSAKVDPMLLNGTADLPHGLLLSDGSGGPQLLVDNSSLSIEEQLLRGQEDLLNIETDVGKSKALEILGRTETGRKRAEEIFGPNIWVGERAFSSRADLLREGPQEDEGDVNAMFIDLTNQDTDDDENVRKGNEFGDDGVTSERPRSK